MWISDDIPTLSVMDSGCLGALPLLISMYRLSLSTLVFLCVISLTHRNTNPTRPPWPTGHPSATRKCGSPNPWPNERPVDRLRGENVKSLRDVLVGETWSGLGGKPNFGRMSGVDGRDG